MGRFFSVEMLGSCGRGLEVGVVFADWGIDSLDGFLLIEMLGSRLRAWGVGVVVTDWEIHSLGGLLLVEMLVALVRGWGVGVVSRGWEIHSLGGFLPVETIFATGAGDTGFRRGVVKLGAVGVEVASLCFFLVGMLSELSDLCPDCPPDCGGMRSLGRFSSTVVVLRLLMKIVGLAFLI